MWIYFQKINLTEVFFTGRVILGFNLFKYKHSSENTALFCIAWGLDLNAQDKEVGMTPLHLAVSSGSVRIV